MVPQVSSDLRLARMFCEPRCDEPSGRRVQRQVLLHGASLGAGAMPLNSSYLEIRYTVFFISVSGKIFFFSSIKQTADMKFLCLLIPN